MTQVYDSANCLVPVTVIQAGPCPIVKVKTADSDGYTAVQIAFEKAKDKALTAAELGHLKKNGQESYRHLQELRVEDASAYNAGEVLSVAEFQVGQKVDVSGTTKGRGFQGVMKRHDFAGGPASHGSMFHRRGGSYGMREWPGRVYKGRKMPGHMGVDVRTVQNLTVVRVIPEKNLLLVKGSIAGCNDGLVMVRTAKKG